MSEEINHDGTIEIDEPQLAASVDELLNQALSQNNWTAVPTLTDGSLRNFDITNSLGETFHLRIFIGKIRVDNTRPANEKKIQLGKKDPRILKVTDTQASRTYILGIYVRNSDDLLEDSIFAAWEILENVNYPGNVSIRLKSELIQKAKIEGFAQMLNDANSLICAFRPEFIFYYILNSELLHNNLRISDRVLDLNQMQNTIFYGAPGTGKSYKVSQKLESVPPIRKEIVTFHPEYDNASFVGGYKPISELNEESGKIEIQYKFVPQAFTNIYVKAWSDSEKNNHYLVIEEINRGNCAEIFGEIFQLLDRKYEITPSKELKDYLQKTLGEDHDGIKDGKMRLPSNLVMLATMNTSDQSLFPMDSAFKRRWNWEYIPIEYSEKYEDGTDNKSFDFVVKVDETTRFRWINFIEVINKIIRQNPNLGMDKCIGNYFVEPAHKEISIEEFINKVIFYLWNDVFRDEENPVFGSDTFYEDFFPIGTNGIAKVREIIEKLGIEQIPNEDAEIVGAEATLVEAVEPETEDEDIG